MATHTRFGPGHDLDHDETTAPSSSVHSAPVPDEPSSQQSPSRDSDAISHTPSSMASINLQKVVRRFSREEGDFFVFTLTSVDVIEEPPTLQDPILSIPGTLFVSICREHSSTKVWIRTVDETWELGRDGDLHPLKPHRCLSISEAGANWVLLKTRQTYKQRNHRRIQMEKVCGIHNKFTATPAILNDSAFTAWFTGIPVDILTPCLFTIVFVVFQCISFVLSTPRV